MVAAGVEVSRRASCPTGSTGDTDVFIDQSKVDTERLDSVSAGVQNAGVVSNPERGPAVGHGQPAA
jgi:cold shock CspA family protein